MIYTAAIILNEYHIVEKAATRLTHTCEYFAKYIPWDVWIFMLGIVIK